MSFQENRRLRRTSLSLTVLAVAAAVAGGHSLLGERGAVRVALTMVLIGNPFSAVGSAPERLPPPVGGIGQLLPPGAGANLVRSTGFFDGGAASGHIAVLLAWALAGVGLILIADARRTRLRESNLGNALTRHPAPDGNLKAVSDQGAP
jgi:hypothetical protein